MSGSREFTKALDELLKNATYDLEKGIFRSEGSRLMILFTDSFVSVQKSIERLIGFDNAGMLLYEAYKEAGRLTGRVYVKNIKTANSRQAIRLGLEFTKALAWGRWEASTFDQNKALFIVRDSPIAESYGKSEHAVCHQIRGLIAGFAEYFTGQKREAVETKCGAKGDDYCEFLVASPENITRLVLERLEENGGKRD